MSTKLKKTAVDAPVLEARIFGDVEDRIKDLDKLARHEFWAMAAVALTNLVSVAAVMGWIDSSGVETLTKSITAVIGGAEIIVLNAIILYRYFTNVQETKREMVRARIDLAHAQFQAQMQIQQMRALENGQR